MAQKRGSIEVSKFPAKKAKSISEEPLLDFINSCGDIPKSCREMLQAGLPHCLEVAESERHRFHFAVLDHVASLLATAEEKKRGAVNAVDKELSEIQVEKGKVAADVTAAKGEVTNKQSELHARGKKLIELRKACDGAAHALSAALERQKVFNARKVGVFTDEDNFRKFMADVWQPLKEDGVTGARRHRLVGELSAKLSELGARHLCDSMESLRTPEWCKGTFGKAAVESADVHFKKHAAKLSQVVLGLDEEEASLKASIAAAELALTEGRATLEANTKEREEMQVDKTSFEKTAAEAVKVQQGLQVRIPPALRRLTKAREDLEMFLELPALFSRLKDLTTAAPEEPTTPNKGKGGEQETEQPRNVPTPVRLRHPCEKDGVARAGSSIGSAPAGRLAREQAAREVNAAQVSLAREQQAASEVKRIDSLRREAFNSDGDWGFSVLNVSSRDIAAVQRSYRVLMAKLHPDRVQYTTTVARALDKLKEAKGMCERCLSKKFVPGVPRKLSCTTLCTEPGSRSYQLQWEAPRDTMSAPVHRFIVAVLDPVHGPLKVAILEPDFNQELGRFVTMQELGSYILAEEELRKVKNLWRQSAATVQVAAANDVGQSDWAVLQVSLGR